jgi:hypothetical protein
VLLALLQGSEGRAPKLLEHLRVDLAALAERIRGWA